MVELENRSKVYAQAPIFFAPPQRNPPCTFEVYASVYMATMVGYMACVSLLLYFCVHSDIDVSQ